MPEPSLAQPVPPPLPRIAFDLPPRTRNADGRLRTVGIEIEFAGLTAEAAAKALALALGGGVNQKDPHAFMVKNSALGDIAVELDLRYVHPVRKKASVLNLGAVLAAWLGSAIRHVVPCELVTAPLPIDRLDRVDRLLSVLREAGAKGTQDGALYAFVFDHGLVRSGSEPPTMFQTVSNSFGEAYLLHLAGDRADPARLFAATGEGQILASADRGRTWVPLAGAAQ